MNFFKKLGEKFSGNSLENSSFFSQENRTEEINSQRNRQKQALIANLQRLQFTPEEINEVTVILDKCEQMVQIIKDDLIGTNINNIHAHQVLDEKLQKMRQYELKAAEDIKAKVAEIIKRKSNNRN